MKLVCSTMRMYVAERGQICAAGDTGAHDRSDLWDAQFATHQGVVEEDAARAVLAGEDTVLIRKIDAGRIDQINDGDAVAHCDLLRAQDLRNGFGPPCAGFHGGIVGDKDCGAAFNFTDAGDNACGGRLAFVSVVGDEQSDFKKAGAGIDETGDAFAGCQLAGAVLLLDALRAAAFAQTASS